MKRVSLISVIVVFYLVIIQSIAAEITLPAIVSSNMVLQRNTTIMLWGWADANEKIAINTSWINEPLNTSADMEGNWKIEVQPRIVRNPNL